MTRLEQAMRDATMDLMEEHGFVCDSQINERNCFDWAFKVFDAVPGTSIGGHNIDGEGQSFIVAEGRCYDCETPDGAAHWWELRSFQRMFRC